jgi:PAS domain S-box-containing protein
MPTPTKGHLSEADQAASAVSADTTVQQGDYQLIKGVASLLDYAIFMLDPDGQIITWNEGASRMYGYAPEEIIGQHVSCLYTAEEIQQDFPQKELSTAIREKRFEQENWRLGKGGKQLWAYTLITATYQDEALLGFCYMSRDLSERKKSEEVLHQSEERFRLLVEGVKDYAIFMLDPQGYIQSWNEGAQRIKGYRADEIIGQHFSKFYPQEAIDRNFPQYELEVASAQGRFEDEGFRLRKNGEPFWANVVITALYNQRKEVIGFAKVTRDLTERKRILDQLQRAKEEAEAVKENYRLLIEGVRDYAIIMLDPQGIVRSWNKGAERIKGYRPDEIIGSHFSKFYPQEDVESGKCDFELQYAELEGVFEDEGLRVRKDGSLFWASVLITVLRNEQGDLIGFSKITRDITDRKNAEQALRESEKRYRMMADKVIQRSREFQALNKQLEAINRELETFSYSVSHDLRAPLRNINGFTRLIMEDKAEQLDDETKDYMEKVCQNTNHMGQLIDDLLKLSRLSRKELRLEPVNLSQMAKDILHDLQAQEPQRQVEIHIQEGMCIQADIGLIRVALYNLLTNAWKFTGKKEKSVIEFGVTQMNDARTFYIRDNGVGFDMKYADMMFGAFQRLHDAREFSGIGVGLATVQRIVHRHGGKIWAEATVNQGATFYFSL